MDIILIILALICFLVGLAGCILPVLPGVPLVWFGLFIARFSSFVSISIKSLFILGLVALAATLFDAFAPVWMTKSSGGTRGGTWGAVVGMILGLSCGLAGIILGPFLGAYGGELIVNDFDFSMALKSAIGSFKGFLLGTVLKLIISGLIIFVFFQNI